MGAFDDAQAIILPDPNDPKKAEEFRKKWKWEPHEQVILRGSYTAAHMEAVTNASVHSDIGGNKKDGKITLQSGTGRIKLMECMIVDWTFGRNGQKVPVSPHTIRQLPHNYQTPILEACDELAKETMDEEAQEDFLISANGHTSVDSIPTKLHLAK
jgi:hypothetical protein